MIFTFYSFKGGVGRSMAMAAVGYLFAQRGLRVLMIDFDLEAPGLERYFFETAQAERMKARPGLMDLLQTYKLALTHEAAFSEARFKSWWQFVDEAVPSTTGGGRVDIMTAGARAPEEKLRDYALAVRSFDWLDFFHNWNGEQFFDWLRKQLLIDLGADAARGYDVVLVDSRTGVTEMGGICAYQLADCAVMLCAANHQNIDGTLAVARDFRSDAVQALRRGRPLDLLVLPARLEQNNDRRKEFLKIFSDAFERSQYLPKALAEAGYDYESLALPYEPAFAVIERLVGDPTEPGFPAAQQAVEQFDKLAKALALLAFRPGKLAERRDALLAERKHGRPSEMPAQLADPTLHSSGFDVMVLHSRSELAIARRLTSRLEKSGLKVFIDIDDSSLAPGSNWQEIVSRALEASEVMVVLLGPGGPDKAMSASIDLALRRGRPRILPAVLGNAGEPAAQQALRLTHLQDHRAFFVNPKHAMDVAGTRLADEVRAFVNSRPQAVAVAVPQRKPFPGARPLGEDDEAFFFGRAKELDALLKLASGVAVTLLQGAAGAGKTSLLRAGLLPALRRQMGHRLSAPPTLHAYIDCATTDWQRAVERWLKAAPAPTPTSARWLLLDSVDSFADDGRPQAVAERVRVVAAALDRMHDGHVVLALRDTLDSAARVDAMQCWRLNTPSRSAASLRIGAMDAAALLLVIEKPAAAMGHVLDPGLAQTLIDSAGSSHSAVAQIARVLPLLWEERRRGWLTSKAYDLAGGVRGVFERDVAQTLQSMTAGQRDAAEVLIRSLGRFDTTLQLTAEPGLWASLQTIEALNAADARSVRDRLAEKHLIDVWRQPPQAGAIGQQSPAAQQASPLWPEGDVTVALVHGAPRFYGKAYALSPDPAFTLWRRLFGAYVFSWQHEGRSPAAVVTGGVLAEAESHAQRQPRWLSEPERSLIEVSVKAREQAAEQAHVSELERHKSQETRRALEQIEAQRVEGRREVMHLKAQLESERTQARRELARLQAQLASAPGQRAAQKAEPEYLHTHWPAPPQGAAVVFVHGFGGDVEGTWGEFPSLLRQTRHLVDWGIFSLGYASNLRIDLVKLWSADPELDEVALRLRTALKHGSLGACASLCLVAHSMGGLAVQRALLDDVALRLRTSHVFLFGTPSGGLTKASWVRMLKPQLRDMSRDGVFIRSLRADWDRRFKPRGRLSLPFRFFVIGGERDEFVPFESSIGPFSSDEYADCRFIVPGNHLDIVKPSHADSLSVQVLMKGLMGDAAPGGPWNAARQAIQSRDFERAVALLEPRRDELDADGCVQLALALEGVGRADAAVELLQRAGGRSSSDVLGVLAGRLKRRWLLVPVQQDGAQALALYREGLALARQAGDPAQAYYLGINVAFMLLAFEKNVSAARRQARTTLADCESAAADERSDQRKWRLATEGEALLMLGQNAKALQRYTAAVACEPSPREMQSMYQQAIYLSRLVGDDALRRELEGTFRPAA